MTAPTTSHTLEEVLTRRASIVQSLADTDAELLKRFGWRPSAVVNLCGHPDRPVFGTLDAQSRPGCFECVRKSHGIKPQDVRAARLHEPDPSDWGDGVLPFVRRSMWGESL